jgi:hypothetical protein
MQPKCFEINMGHITFVSFRLHTILQTSTLTSTLNSFILDFWTSYFHCLKYFYRLILVFNTPPLPLTFERESILWVQPLPEAFFSWLFFSVHTTSSYLHHNITLLIRLRDKCTISSTPLRLPAGARTSSGSPSNARLCLVACSRHSVLTRMDKYVLKP